jgi:hypothetical protein
LRKPAAESIFFSWYYGHLDPEVTPEEMCILSELRQDYPDLDAELHAICQDQVDFLDGRKKKREAERAAENAATNDDGMGGFDNAGGFENGGGFDDQAAGFGQGSTDTWEEQAAGLSATNDWDKPAPGQEGDGGGDWADEVNDQVNEPAW